MMTQEVTVPDQEIVKHITAGNSEHVSFTVCFCTDKTDEVLVSELFCL